MKKFIYILSISFFVACTSDFEDINTNPNAPTQVQPSLLLRQVIYDYGEQMSYEGFVAGDLLGQYRTAIDFNLFDRHSLKDPQLGGNPWPVYYTNLRDNESILQLAEDNDSYTVYKGPSLILKAYMAAALTDAFGDVPYSEALSGKEGNVTPAYDSQQDIYLAEGGIIDNLNQGIAAIESYQGAIDLEGDILYTGDLSAWIRFANSLKIKYLMRISAVSDVRSQLQEVIDDNNYISQNMGNATFNFTDGQPNNFRLATLRDGDYNLFIMSETMDEILEKYEDPRAEIFFKPAANSGTFEGFLNGPDASQTSISVADYSLAGSMFRENTGMLSANFMTAWETNFLIAEADAKNLITVVDAEASYNLAVTQAFEYWQTPLPANYLTVGNAAFAQNGNDPIQQIIEQKWLANIINGYEGWIEWKRTGYPELKTIAASLNNDIIPVRMPYPASEVTLNKESFEAATGSEGNSIDTKVWWDAE